MTITAQQLDPSHHYCCEHDDCDDRPQLTVRTESSERYCIPHFPVIDCDEHAVLADIADNTTER